MEMTWNGLEHHWPDEMLLNGSRWKLWGACTCAQTKGHKHEMNGIKTKESTWMVMNKWLLGKACPSKRNICIMELWWIRWN